MESASNVRQFMPRPWYQGAMQGENKEHHLVLTGTPGTNMRKVRVRCRCMAEYRSVSLHYYNYDWIADVETLEEAKQVYAAHLKEDPLYEVNMERR